MTLSIASVPSLNLALTDTEGGRLVKVDSTPFTIGRKPDCNLVIASQDMQVSRLHAELICEGDVWHVRDCGSRFGIYVNGVKVESETVHTGDRLRLGLLDIRVESEDQSTVFQSASFDFRQVNALLRGLRGLGSSHVLDEVLALVLDSALELTGAERGFILLSDGQQDLTPMLARAQGGITLSNAAISHRIPAKVFATGQDEIVQDLRDEQHASDHQETIQHGIRHVLCTPLNAIQFGSTEANRRIGVLYLDSRDKGYLQQSSALHVLAVEAAIVIENARLYREVVDKEREAQELRVAASIQQSLLPPPRYDSPLVELAAASTPCREVGGDFFEYAPIDTDSFLFSVADVAGKGPSAALLTAVMQGLLSGQLEASNTPDRVLTRVNAGLCRRPVDGRFVTAFYGYLTADGRLRFSNAGHNPPLLLSGNTVHRLEATGCPLGLFESMQYEAEEIQVSSGDLIVAFSDGVTEAVNPEDEEMGEERLLACLKTVQAQPVAVILEAVQNAVRLLPEPRRQPMTSPSWLFASSN